MEQHLDLEQRLRDLAFHWRGKGFKSDADVYELAADFIENQRRRLGRTVTALEPFAEIGNRLKQSGYTDEELWPTAEGGIKVIKLKNAAAAIE